MRIIFFFGGGGYLKVDQETDRGNDVTMYHKETRLAGRNSRSSGQAPGRALVNAETTHYISRRSSACPEGISKHVCVVLL